MTERDPTDLQGQIEDEEKRKARAKREEVLAADDLRWLMGTKRGRRMMWRDLEKAGVFNSPFDTNAMTMAFKAGNKQAATEKLADIMQYCPEKWEMMLRENANHD